MFRTILLSVDLNDPKGSEKPARAAQELAALMGSELHVVNVVPDYSMAMVGSFFGAGQAARALEESKAAMHRWAARSLPEVPEDRLHVVKGTVYDRILSVSEKIGADVIVVGAHRPELEDYLVGPNSARVVRHANQSVIVIR